MFCPSKFLKKQNVGDFASEDSSNASTISEPEYYEVYEDGKQTNRFKYKTGPLKRRLPQNDPRISKSEPVFKKMKMELTDFASDFDINEACEESLDKKMSFFYATLRTNIEPMRCQNKSLTSTSQIYQNESWDEIGAEMFMNTLVSDSEIVLKDTPHLFQRSDIHWYSPSKHEKQTESGAQEDAQLPGLLYQNSLFYRSSPNIIYPIEKASPISSFIKEATPIIVTASIEKASPTSSLIKEAFPTIGTSPIEKITPISSLIKKDATPMIVNPPIQKASPISSLIKEAASPKTLCSQSNEKSENFDPIPAGLLGDEEMLQKWQDHFFDHINGGKEHKLKEISIKQSQEWLKKSLIIDGIYITCSDVQQLFKSCLAPRKSTMNTEEYEQYLSQFCKLHYLDSRKVFMKMIECPIEPK